MNRTLQKETVELNQRKKVLLAETSQLQIEARNLRFQGKKIELQVQDQELQLKNWQKTSKSFTDRIRRYKIQIEELKAKRDDTKKSSENATYRLALKRTKKKLYDDLMKARRMLREKQKGSVVQELKSALEQKEVRYHDPDQTQYHYT